MRIAVFGTGGVGGYFGGRLAQTGEDVTFIARGAHLQAIRQNGLRVDSIKGDFHISSPKATDDPAEAGIMDYILVAVKAGNVPEAARLIPAMVDSNTTVVPLENGVEAPDQLASVLGERPVLGGLCKIISYIAGPGHIKHAAAEPSIEFGELDSRRTDRVERLRAAFEKAGVQVVVPADIKIAMWEKFLFIASVSGMGAITRAPIGIIRIVPQTRSMLEQCFNEIYRIARAKNADIGEDSVERAMRYVDNLAAAGTTSLQRDILEGRPSELEYQTGTIVRLSKQLGIDAPINTFIYHALLPGEMKARGTIQY